MYKVLCVMLLTSYAHAAIIWDQDTLSIRADKKVQQTLEEGLRDWYFTLFCKYMAEKWNEGASMEECIKYAKKMTHTS